jgi:hypothetical protein
MTCPFTNSLASDHVLFPLTGWVDISGMWTPGYLNTRLQSDQFLLTSTFDPRPIFQKGDKFKLTSTLGKVTYAFVFTLTPGTIALTRTDNFFGPNPTLTASDFISKVEFSRLSNPKDWPSFFSYDAVAAGRFTHAITSGTCWTRFNVGPNGVVELWFDSNDIIIGVTRITFECNYPPGIIATNRNGRGAPLSDAAGAGQCISSGPYAAQSDGMFSAFDNRFQLFKSDLSNWTAGNTHTMTGHIIIPI